jgi:hypothetical protein
VWGLSIDTATTSAFRSFELSQLFIEGVQLGGADEGEIERIEKQDHVLALEIAQFEVLGQLLPLRRRRDEIRRLSFDQVSHSASPFPSYGSFTRVRPSLL